MLTLTNERGKHMRIKNRRLTGYQLRQARKALGWTVEQAATSQGILPASQRRYERGYTLVTPKGVVTKVVPVKAGVTLAAHLLEKTGI